MTLVDSLHDKRNKIRIRYVNLNHEKNSNVFTKQSEVILLKIDDGTEIDQIIK